LAGAHQKHEDDYIYRTFKGKTRAAAFVRVKVDSFRAREYQVRVWLAGHAALQIAANLVQPLLVAGPNRKKGAWYLR